MVQVICTRPAGYRVGLVQLTHGLNDVDEAAWKAACAIPAMVGGKLTTFVKALLADGTIQKPPRKPPAESGGKAASAEG